MSLFSAQTPAQNPNPTGFGTNPLQGQLTSSVTNPQQNPTINRKQGTSNPLQGMLGTSVNPSQNPTTQPQISNPLQGMLTSTTPPSNVGTNAIAQKPGSLFSNVSGQVIASQTQTKPQQGQFSSTTLQQTTTQPAGNPQTLTRTLTFGNDQPGPINQSLGNNTQPINQNSLTFGGSQSFTSFAGSHPKPATQLLQGNPQQTLGMQTGIF